MLRKAETQNVRVWGKEGFIDRKMPTENMETLVLPQIHLAGWTRPRDLKGLGRGGTGARKCWRGKF